VTTVTLPHSFSHFQCLHLQILLTLYGNLYVTLLSLRLSSQPPLSAPFAKGPTPTTNASELGLPQKLRRFHLSTQAPNSVKLSVLESCSKYFGWCLVVDAANVGLKEQFSQWRSDRAPTRRENARQLYGTIRSTACICPVLCQLPSLGN